MTIPQEIREEFGLLPGTEVKLITKNNTVQIVKVKTSRPPSRGQALVQRLRGRSTVRMSTDEILALTRK